MVAAGIIGSAKVVRCALKNLASVAAMVLATQSLTTDEDELRLSNHRNKQMSETKNGSTDYSAKLFF